MCINGRKDMIVIQHPISTRDVNVGIKLWLLTGYTPRQCLEIKECQAMPESWLGPLGILSLDVFMEWETIVVMFDI